jgi:hypothetical protein
MSRITVALTTSSASTHVPLAALGYALRRAEVLLPLYELALPLKHLQHSPADKLTTGLVLMSAGGRALYQTNWLLRPNRALAQAWGMPAYAEQSTISDTFDALNDTSVQHLAAAFAEITRTWSQTCQHDFRRGDLILDGDLTGLPAARQAEGSRKGYFAGKKTVTAGNWRGSPRRVTVSRWARFSFLARKRAKIAWNRWC